MPCAASNYDKDVNEAHCKQIASFTKKDIIFDPNIDIYKYRRGRYLVFTEFAYSIIYDMRSKVKAYPSVEVYWNDEQTCTNKSVTAMMQVNSDCTTTTLGANRMI